MRKTKRLLKMRPVIMIKCLMIKSLKIKSLKIKSLKIKSRGVICGLVLACNSSVLLAMSDIKQTEKVDTVPEVSSERLEVENSKTLITEIKSKPPFVDKQQKKVWNFQDTDEEESTSDLDPDLQWLTAIISFISMLVEAALWLIPLIVLFYFYKYRYYWLNLLQGKSFKPDVPDIPDTLFGLDMRKESLPDDIEQAARQLWQQKKYREAVSLLYRGSLVALFKQYHFELAPGATEQDCIRQIELSQLQATQLHSNRADQVTPESATSQHINTMQQSVVRFKQLTDIWISVAYAHKLPDSEQFMQVCDGWNQHYSHSGGKP